MERGEATETAVKQVVPFLRVADMARSLRFYVDGLGFTMTQKWVQDGTLRWCWLELGGASLMLQQFPTEGANSWTPTGTVGEGVTLYLICEDTVQVYRHLRSRGIEATRPCVGNGMWEVALRDPDGYRLEFESPTKEPEESVYTGD